MVSTKCKNRVAGSKRVATFGGPENVTTRNSGRVAAGPFG